MRFGRTSVIFAAAVLSAATFIFASPQSAPDPAEAALDSEE
jgi:hypothetical protein